MLLALGYRNEYARRIAAGVARAAAGLGWTYVLAPDVVDDPARARRLAWRPDGIISLGSGSMTRALDQLGIPHVGLGFGSPHRQAVGLDEAALAQLAVRHLAGRGYSSLAFVSCGAGSLRGEAFRAAAAERGLPVAECSAGWLEADADPRRLCRRIGQWLTSLPGPVGVFCHNDGFAHAVLAACQRAGLAVPVDIGVLGCDDDPVFARLGHIPLSSVVPDHEESGFRAGRRLARMLAGLAPEPDHPVVPISVAERASTDLRLLQDALVTDALTWIRQHSGSVFAVDDVAAAMGVHRRTLERRVHAALGCSVLDAIHQAAFSRAQTALRAGMPVQAAARTVGLSSSSLRQLIRSRAGISPREMRQRQGPR